MNKRRSARLHGDVNEQEKNTDLLPSDFLRATGCDHLVLIQDEGEMRVRWGE